MKRISFVLHQRPAYAVDWRSLVESPGEDDIYILVTTDECMQHLSEQDLDAFSDTIRVKDFSFEALAEKMDAKLKDIYQNGDEIRMAVLSEFTMTVAASLRDHFKDTYNMLGPYSDVIEQFRNKIVMKELLGKQGVRIPKYEHFDAEKYLSNPAQYIQQMKDYLDFPMFAKPIDSGGSIGTAMINDQQDLIAWCERAANDKAVQYEVDEFIEGDLFHCDSIHQDGEVKFTFINRYLNPNADARSGKGLGSITMSEEDEDYAALAEFTKNTLPHFPVIPDGFTHMEVFKSKKGELIFLEIAARAPGAKAPEIFQIRTGGLDMRWLHMRLNLGLSIEKELAHLADKANWGPYAAMFQDVAPAKGGVITSINEPKMRGNYQVFTCTSQVGDTLKPNESILDTTCSMVCSNANYAELKADFLALNHQTVVQTAPVTAEQTRGWILPNFISRPISAAQAYLSSMFDAMADAMVKHACEVTRECPSYFPPNNPNYWSNGGTATLFNQHSCTATVNQTMVNPPPNLPCLPRV